MAPWPPTKHHQAVGSKRQIPSSSSTCLHNYVCALRIQPNRAVPSICICCRDAHTHGPVVGADSKMGACCSTCTQEDTGTRTRDERNRHSGNKWGGGRALGTGEGPSQSPEDLRQAALNAAESRRESNLKGLDVNKHKRDQLVGKILSYYASAGIDPPLGLSASQDMAALKKHA